MIELGNKVRDNITGFEGIVVARTEWINGCIRFHVQPEKLTKDGKIIDDEWFDAQRLVVVSKAKPKVSKDSVAKAGGPQKDPSW